MEKLLLVAALACQPGDRLIDLSGKLPRGLQFMDLVVSVEPFYTRFYIYQLGFPQSRQQCCSNTITKPYSSFKPMAGTTNRSMAAMSGAWFRRKVFHP
jgi:hypothetical protein